MNPPILMVPGERGPDPRIVIGLWPQSEDVGQQDEKLRVNAPHPPSTLARERKREGLLECLELVREWKGSQPQRG